MSAFHDNALLGASGQQGYKISRSVRLRSSASAYFNRTFGSGSRTTWTWNCWVKRGAVGVAYPTTNYAQTLFGLNDSDKIYFYEDALWLYLGTGAIYVAQPSDKFRDPSAWYHIVVVLDTTNATSGDRIRIYVNNRRVTISQTMPTQNWASSNLNSAVNHNIGKADNGNLYYLDGYLTEIHFIDGQALTPSSFGETDTTTGVWKPKKYTGTYGTNGFYLNFSDNSNNTAATIGKDYSGNGNNWTPNNISVTAGVTYDSMVDSPTVGATSSNYCVMNPVDQTLCTVSNGNLSVTTNVGGYGGATRGTISVSSGKWYWESTITANGGSAGQAPIGGIMLSTTPLTTWTSYGYYGANGYKTSYVGGSLTSVAYGSTFTTGDIIGYALDLDAGTLTFYKNNVSQGTAFTGLSGTFSPVIWDPSTGGTTAINFGQRPFSYTPPTGFVALNTQNLPTPTISNGAQYFAASTYTANASTQTINNGTNNPAGITFQPDWVWTKSRTGAYSHQVFDVLRGVNAYMGTNQTAAEIVGTAQLTSFNSNGFTLGSNENSNFTNGYAAVAWNWKAGGTGVTNTSGSITSTVSAGATQGFSVVTYTGTGANATVGHGLGVAPKMIIVKNRSAGSTNWCVYHVSVGNQYATLLNSTSTPFSNSNYWNNTTPTSTVFSLGNGTDTNGNTNNFVAYCFAEVAGYSKAFSYTGNGSTDGPFVFLGFRARWLMFKRTDASADWIIFDTSRNTYNLTNLELNANLSGAEFDTAAFRPVDILSNGFKLRGSNGGGNASGGTYIGFAVAENPFKLALAR
jgi:hypothetical protein